MFGGMRRVALIVVLVMPAISWAISTGDSKAQVLAELGPPSATMSAGNREFLTYPQGRVELTKGVVSGWRGSFPSKGQAASEAEAEPESADPNIIKTKYPRGHWFTDFEAAMEEADSTDKRILALFTGSDWCPPCQKFEAEVAHDEQFANIFSPYFVFFKCDWLRNTPQPPEVAAKVDQMSKDYDISQYPTLKVLDSHGDELDEVDWTSVRGGTFKEAMIEAIDDSRKATRDGKKASSSWWPF